ncbi:MAG TPA: polynucleotide adenylyltransferase PcnB, partial [Pseudomonadales bacterium]|nr:polynucleotide adenylyltransferase PcnB [Pseudomonadales bacterium]
AAYDFLLLREQVGEELNGLGSWWTQYQTASPEEREQLRQNLQRDSSAPRNPRRRRNSRKTTTH